MSKPEDKDLKEYEISPTQVTPTKNNYKNQYYYYCIFLY